MLISSDFLRAPERPTAIATLNRQRHLTPSCGGLTPTAERTVGPVRISLESLTPRPGIREHNRRQSGRNRVVWSLSAFDPGCVKTYTAKTQSGRLPSPAIELQHSV